MMTPASYLATTASAMTPAFFVCRGPVAWHWQLGTVDASDRFTMIGWRTIPPRVDGGMPVPVAQVLAAALATVADVAFIGGDAAITRARTAAAAMRAFDLPQQPWSQQAQTVLLLDRHSSSIEIDRTSLRNLLSNDWKSHTASLAGTGVLGAVRPGVDGDVAGILSFTAAFESRVTDALADEARRTGFAWIELDEAAFAEALAEG